MNSFSSFGACFSSVMEQTVDSCRNINDQLIVFDGAGTILAVRSSDPELRDAQDFFSLLEEGERAFFEANCTDFSRDRLTLMTKHGAAVVFCHLFPACGLFVAVLMDSEVLLTDGHVGGRGEFPYSETLRLATEALCFEGERNGTVFDLARVLVDRVCAMARLVGCHAVCRAEVLLTLSDAFVFNLPTFCSTLLLLLLQARRDAADRAANVTLFARDGRVFAELSAEMGGETEMLALCRGMAERKDFPFEVRHAGARETVTFSPTVCDVSYLGLKNPFLFE